MRSKHDIIRHAVKRDGEETNDALTALRQLTLEDVEKRLADIDGERASLSLLRRSLVARKRAQKQTQQRSGTGTENRRDE